MSLEQVREELLVLWSSLKEDERQFVEEDERRAWEPALSGDDVLPDSLPFPALSLRLASQVHLTVQYRQQAAPSFSLHSLILGRRDQARLKDQLEKQVEVVRVEESPLPVFTVFTAMQEYLASRPPSSASAETTPEPAPQAGPFFQLKTTLLWSHHLLATSKRKDILAISAELELWGVSKPGYPGIFIVEGIEDRVDDFVHRVKQWQWKALQVRCEQPGALVHPPSTVPANEGATWVMRNKALLAPVLGGKDGRDKVCVKEVEGLNEVGEIMKQAGMYNVFLTAMKLSK
ncbi:hypothetical protein JCM8547_005006 [Rhodosporidiobolus lusitaniae]